MLIDRSHRRWMILTVGAFVAAAALYIWYRNASGDGPRGKSVPGMLFGISGTLLMLFAGLLSARKKFPNWRLGKVQTWLRAHIWLGLLSVPLILFHAGFRWGGLLETVLLWLLVAIVFSGLFGLALQNLLPRLIAPQEVAYDQISNVCAGLCKSADEEVFSACGSVFESAADTSTLGDAGSTLREFYRSSVRPYLGPGNPRASDLHDHKRSQDRFDQVRSMLPERLHSVLERLSEMCDERRQIAQQARLQLWLHGWLFVHLPLSLALLVLTVVHIFTSLIVY